MKKYKTLDNDRALELVFNIQNDIDVEQSYNELVESSYKMRSYLRREYLPIVMKYDLEFDDVEQEMLIGLLRAVKNCPVDCKSFSDYLFQYFRGACLDYFKFNTNRLMPHSRNKEKRLEEFEYFSLNSNINEYNEYQDLLVDENSHLSYFGIIENQYNKYVIDTIKKYLLNKFENVNIDLFIDFFKLTFEQLEEKYNYPKMNIFRYVNYIITVLKTSDDFYSYCQEYLYDVLVERGMYKYNYTMNNFDKIDINSILVENIVTDYTNTSILDYSINKDVKIRNYFRVRFIQSFCN